MSNTRPLPVKLNLTNPCKNKDGKIPKPTPPKEVLGFTKQVIRVAIGKPQ